MLLKKAKLTLLSGAAPHPAASHPAARTTNADDDDDDDDDNDDDNDDNDNAGRGDGDGDGGGGGGHTAKSNDSDSTEATRRRRSLRRRLRSNNRPISSSSSHNRLGSPTPRQPGKRRRSRSRSFDHVDKADSCHGERRTDGLLHVDPLPMQNRGRQRLRLHGDVEATVPPGVPGFGSPTTSVAFDKLIEAGIRSEMDLLVTSEDYIMANTDLDRLTIDRMRMLVAKRNSCPSLSAVEALAAEKKTRKLLTSGCPGIDVLLGHGLKSGDIVEFAGPPSTGKSQLAFFATVAALATRPTGTVLFVDSCGSFSPDRLQHMFSESDRFTRHRESMTPSGLFSRLRCVECFDSFEFIGILYSLQHLLAAKESDFFKNLMLIVIDSIGALLSPVVGDGRGQAVVETVGRMLKMISVVHGAPIMTVNYAVTNFSRKNELSRPKQKPALGHAWAEVPTTTLFFSKPTSATREELDEAVAAAEVGRARGDGAAGLKSGNGTGSVRVSTYTNQRGVDIQVKTRKVEVLRSPDEKLKGAWRYLYLGQGEVISFEEEDQ